MNASDDLPSIFLEKVLAPWLSKETYLEVGQQITHDQCI